MPDFQPDLAALDRVFTQAPRVVAETPADWQQQAARAQAAQALAQEQRAKAQQAAEDRADEQLIRQIGAEVNGDPEQMITRLRVVNPRVAMKFDEEWGKVQKQNLERAKLEIDNERALGDKHAGLLKMAEGRPDLWPTVRASIVKGDPTMDQVLPVEHDPAKIAPVYQMWQTAKGILDADAKSLEYIAKGDFVTGVALAFSDPTMDAQEWEQTKAGLIQNRVPRFYVEQAGEWSPDAWKRMQERAMTPAQRAAAEKESPLVQVEGPGGTSVWTTREQAVGQPVGRAPTSEGALVQVVGPGGVVTWQTRENAEGKRAPRPESGSGGEKAATPTARLTATMTLQNRYNTQTKAAQTSATAVSQMRESIKAVKSGSMAAGSQGVLVTFQKLLDPTSVVRESEYDRSSAGQAMMARLQGQYDRIVSGGAGVPVAELEKFVSLAEAYNRNAQLSASRLKQQFDAIAKDFGLNPEHITRDFEEEAEASPAAPTSGAAPTHRWNPKTRKTERVP